MRTGVLSGAALFAADVEHLVLGEVEAMRDKIAIARYPSRDGMRDMRCSPKMRQIGIHRATGLASQLNVETAGASGA
jgi:hypothetical protein